MTAMNRNWLSAVLKRLFPPGSFGRRLLYRLRANTGKWLFTSRGKPHLPIEADIERFISWVHEQESHQIVLIMASTRLIESEGQRSTNFALELSRRGIPCIFGYWRWKKNEWYPQDRLAGGILQIPVDAIAEWPEIILRRFSNKEKIILFEFPHPSFFKVLAEAHAAGWVTIYDVIDDWGEFQRVGQADWYEPSMERHLLHNVDAVSVVNQTLGKAVSDQGIKGAEQIPNASFPEIDKVDEDRYLKRGEITIGYFGYLAGAWFDWDLLSETAVAHPTWMFYLIGYGGDSRKKGLPPNVHLLGKRERNELASLASNWDVGMIPFKQERLASGADPIKAYEYLAMNLPVVATGISAPVGAEDLVRRVKGADAFAQAIKTAAEEGDRYLEARAAFAAENTWVQRIDQLLSMIERGGQRIAEKRALFHRVE